MTIIRWIMVIRPRKQSQIDDMKGRTGVSISEKNKRSWIYAVYEGKKSL